MSPADLHPAMLGALGLEPDAGPLEAARRFCERVLQRTPERPETIRCVVETMRVAGELMDQLPVLPMAGNEVAPDIELELFKRIGKEALAVAGDELRQRPGDIPWVLSEELWDFMVEEGVISRPRNV